MNASTTAEQVHHSDWMDHAVRAGLVAYGVVHLLVGWLALQLAFGEKEDSASNSGALHYLAQQPMGGALVWMIAVGMFLLVVWRLLEFAFGYGGSLVYRGWTAKCREHLDAQGQAGKDGSVYVLMGKIGYIAKGVAIAIVGGLFCYAAITHDPKKSGGLDQALQTVLEQPFGQVLLTAIALGIAAYGVFCFARAKHLSR